MLEFRFNFLTHENRRIICSFNLGEIDHQCFRTLGTLTTNGSCFRASGHFCKINVVFKSGKMTEQTPHRYSRGLRLIRIPWRNGPRIRRNHCFVYPYFAVKNAKITDESTRGWQLFTQFTVSSIQNPRATNPRITKKNCDQIKQTW